MRARRGGLVALCLALALAGCRGETAAPPTPPTDPPPAPAAPPEPQPAGRPAARIDRAWLAAARAAMERPVETDCGPYRLITDARASGAPEVCRRIATDLDAVYRARLGLQPVGEPVGAVLLFDRREDFRRWAAESAGLRAGYAGFSRASRGIVALPADAALLASTLAHELTHLVNRRALGFDLPPWLSEGLADAIGDTASSEGLGELAGIRGVEGQARRLSAAYRSPRPPRLARLATLARDEFDRAVPSYDYEQSALAVRWLLLEADLAPGFRSFLADLAGGRPYAAEELPEAVGAGWSELDERLAVWLERQLSLVSDAL